MATATQRNAERLDRSRPAGVGRAGKFGREHRPKEQEPDPDLELEIEFDLALELQRLATIDDETDRGRVVLELVMLRRAFGLSQSDLAKRMSVSQATLSEFESGGGTKLSTLQRYARAVGAKLVVVVVPLVEPPAGKAEGSDG